MTNPQGKHLGRRPEDKTRAKVQLAPFLQNYDPDGFALPVFPPQLTIPELGYPMDRNDQAGDCVVAAQDHALKVIQTLLTGSYVQPSDTELLRRYQTQNPGFRSWADGGGPNDNGMVIAEYLDWCIKEGLILAYAQIDTSSQVEIEAAIYIGLAIVTGEDLRVAQQDGKTWDYVLGSPDWGGHCTVWHEYWPPKVITWGEDDYSMTPAFIERQVDEAYFVLTQAHVDHPSFRNNFDLAGFAAAVKDITNGKVIVPTDPPGPEDWADAALVAAGNRWERTVWSRFTRAGKFKAAFDAWKQAKGY